MHGGPVRAAPTLQLSRAANTTTASARLRTQGRGAPHAAQNSGPGEPHTRLRTQGPEEPRMRLRTQGPEEPHLFPMKWWDQMP